MPGKYLGVLIVTGRSRKQVSTCMPFWCRNLFFSPLVLSQLVSFAACCFPQLVFISAGPSIFRRPREFSFPHIGFFRSLFFAACFRERTVHAGKRNKVFPQQIRKGRDPPAPAAERPPPTPCPVIVPTGGRRRSRRRRRSRGGVRGTRRRCAYPIQSRVVPTTLHL